MKHLVAVLSLAILVAFAVPAGASELRIALDQDPDVLDPAQAGTYVEPHRLCGDVRQARRCRRADENSCPQLATSSGAGRPTTRR